MDICEYFARHAVKSRPRGALSPAQLPVVLIRHDREINRKQRLGVSQVSVCINVLYTCLV
jgi:hypothetical protein